MARSNIAQANPAQGATTMTFFPWPPMNNDFNWDLDVTKDFEAYIDLDFDTDVSYESYVDVNSNIDVCVDIHGNSATFNVDVQAIGDDSAVEANVLAIVTDEYSSLTITGYAAVA
jgi:hypothetical protein